MSHHQDFCVAGAATDEATDHHAHDPGPPEKHGLHFEHCPFCQTHAGSFSLLPAAEIVIPLTAGALVRPLLYFHSPRPLFAWTSAQPRAPPVAS